MNKNARFYELRTKDGAFAGSVWADEVTTARYIREDPYCRVFGTFFWHQGIMAAETWSDCLDWRTA